MCTLGIDTGASTVQPMCQSPGDGTECTLRFAGNTKMVKSYYTILYTKRLCCHSDGPDQAGERSREESHYINKGQCQVLIVHAEGQMAGSGYSEPIRTLMLHTDLRKKLSSCSFCRVSPSAYNEKRSSDTEA